MKAVEILVYKNTGGKCPSLITLLYNLALEGIDYNCDITKYSQVNTGTNLFPSFDVEASQALITIKITDQKVKDKIEKIKEELI